MQDSKQDPDTDRDLDLDHSGYATLDRSEKDGYVSGEVLKRLVLSGKGKD
jgi:hypothetical protein